MMLHRPPQESFGLTHTGRFDPSTRINAYRDISERNNMTHND